MLTFVSPKAASLHYVLTQIDLQYASDPLLVAEITYLNGLLPLALFNLISLHGYAFAKDPVIMDNFHYHRCSTVEDIESAVMALEQHPDTYPRIVIVDDPVTVGFRSGHDYPTVNFQLVSVAQSLKRTQNRSYILGDDCHFLAVQAHDAIVV